MFTNVARNRMALFSIALLLFCFEISTPSIRISSAVTAVMVTALIGWCIRNAWESSDERGAWIGRMVPYATRVLERVHDARDDLFARILRRGDTPSHPYGHSGSLHAISDARVNV